MTIKLGRFEKHGDSWHAVIRVPGADRDTVVSLVGKFASLKTKAGNLRTVTLGPVVRDYGDGDVTVFQIADGTEVVS